ncbi:heavy-metal-associated domain-containing protein [Acetobacterium woodii]|uniref:HMA domain-containing protein n=1 Tax=Acetobacterium woodii (strain ATCC 29683 / DSM 1030 / JCM 2381 / KCTC 1655 / WB1) TaxID=931626 RepID=H6LCZ2_ACEWD|nr:heavy-metal-associated domain-containing protein [Acetobacterium woodii]AFA47831.1 hypothetical protein Awo_c10450 [Acetobacterium woodii DSM 1030]
MKDVFLKVDGIMCGKCVKKVTETLMGHQGIETVSISEDFKEVSVKIDENKIDVLQIGNIIEKIEDKSFKIIN